MVLLVAVLTSIVFFILRHPIFCLEFLTTGVTSQEMFEVLSDNQEEINYRIQRWNQISNVLQNFDTSSRISYFINQSLIDFPFYLNKNTQINNIHEHDKNTLNIISNYWIVYSKFLKALNVDEAKLKIVIDNMKTTSGNATINDFTSAIDLNLDRLFEVSEVIYKICNDNQYTIKAILEGLGANEETIQAFFNALNAPFKEDNIALSKFINLIAYFIGAGFEMIRTFKSIAFNIISNLLEFVKMRISPFELSISSRIKYLIEGFQQYIIYFDQCNLIGQSKEGISQIESTLNRTSTEGIPVQTMINNSFGEEFLDNVMDLLSGIKEGTDSVFQTIEKVINLTGNEKLISINNEFRGSIEKYGNTESKIDQLFGDIETAINGQNENKFINEYTTIISQLANRELAFYNYTFLRDMFNMTSRQLEAQWNSVKNEIIKLSVNESVELPEEVKQPVSSGISLIESNPRIFHLIKDELNINFDDIQGILQQICVLLGTIDKLLFSKVQIVSQIYQTLSTIHNQFNDIKDLTLSEIFEYYGFGGFERKAVEILKPLNESYYPKNILKENYFLNQVKTIDNLRTITVPSIGNIIDAIVCGEEDLKGNETETFFTAYKLDKRYENITNIDSHLKNDTLTVKLFLEYHSLSYDFDSSSQSFDTFLKDPKYSIKQGANSSTTGGKLFDVFTLFLNDIENNSLKMETIDAVVEEIGRIIGIDSSTTETNVAKLDKTTLIIVVGAVVVILIVVVCIAICIAKRKNDYPSDENIQI